MDTSCDSSSQEEYRGQVGRNNVKKDITWLCIQPVNHNKGMTPRELQGDVVNLSHVTVDRWVEEQVKTVVLGRLWELKHQFHKVPLDYH